MFLDGAWHAARCRALRGRGAAMGAASPSASMLARAASILARAARDAVVPVMPTGGKKINEYML